MLGQKPNYGVGEVLRILDTGLSPAARVGGDFYYISFLSLDLRCDLGEGILSFGIQLSLTGTKANLGVIDLLVLIEVRDGGVQLRGLRAGLLRQCVRLIGGGAGGGGGSAGLPGGGFGLTDTGLGAGVYVFNVCGIARLKLIELVEAVLDRIELPIDPLFAGEGVDFSPEAFVGLGCQRMAGGVGAVGVGVRLGGGACLDLRGSLGRGLLVGLGKCRRT